MKKKFFSLPTKYAYLYLFIPIALSIIVSTSYDNDIWFLLNQGRYVVTHGIPYIEPFTIHEGLDFVMQQHLAATIFYEAYHLLGGFGLSLVVIIINLLILFFLYKTALIMSDNRKALSVFFAIGVDILLLMNFIRTRPQIFTYLLLCILLYLLEKYQKEGKVKYLLPLPILSLLEINLHASMWFMLLLFILPYIVENTISYFQKTKKSKVKVTPLWISVLFMIVFALINPYGIDAIRYIFTSYGNEEINYLIFEMQYPDITTNAGMIVYGCILLVFLCYMFFKKPKIKIRHFCLLLGTTYLALTTYKSLAFFIIGGVFPLVAYLKEYFSPKEKPLSLREPVYRKTIILLSIITLLPIFGLSFQLTNPLEKIFDYLENYPEEIVLYTGFMEGGYSEYRGIKPYIDPRAEVFLKANNHQKDIFKEYYTLQTGRLDPGEFLKRYPFTHLLVSEKDDLYPYLQSHPQNYTLVFEDKHYQLYQTNKE